MNQKSLIATVCLPALLALPVAARLTDRLAASHQSFLENRRAALPGLSDPFGVPAPAKMVLEAPKDALRSLLDWHHDVVATVFWIGEPPGEHNPTPNRASAWDRNWMANYGGCDDPLRRDGFLPAAFRPALNPFYIALPYNDVAPGGHHRPEAADVIPWFWQEYRGDGISVCKSHWVELHREGKICYAQWEDVGPFETDHWQYVFGPEAPRANRNHNAGIDLSPAVRDYFGLRGGETLEWRFVDDHQIPSGPWSDWDQGAAAHPR